MEVHFTRIRLISHLFTLLVYINHPFVTSIIYHFTAILRSYYTVSPILLSTFPCYLSFPFGLCLSLSILSFLILHFQISVFIISFLSISLVRATWQYGSHVVALKKSTLVTNHFIRTTVGTRNQSCKCNETQSSSSSLWTETWRRSGYVQFVLNATLMWSHSFLPPKKHSNWNRLEYWRCRNGTISQLAALEHIDDSMVIEFNCRPCDRAKFSNRPDSTNNNQYERRKWRCVYSYAAIWYSCLQAYEWTLKHSRTRRPLPDFRWKNFHL